MLVFLKNKYNVKTCMYTIPWTTSPLYQIINFNVSIKYKVGPKCTYSWLIFDYLLSAWQLHIFEQEKVCTLFRTPHFLLHFIVPLISKRHTARTRFPRQHISVSLQPTLWVSHTVRFSKQLTGIRSVEL